MDDFLAIRKEIKAKKPDYSKMVSRRTGCPFTHSASPTFPTWFPSNDVERLLQEKYSIPIYHVSREDVYEGNYLDHAYIDVWTYSPEGMPVIHQYILNTHSFSPLQYTCSYSVFDADEWNPELVDVAMDMWEIMRRSCGDHAKIMLRSC
jgi:hypothetical protein